MQQQDSPHDETEVNWPLPFYRYGNVEFGEGLEKSEILDYFDAIIYAVGLQNDRQIGLPGEDLPGSWSATQFVGWYNGHPDYQHLKFDFTNKKKELA